MIGSSFLIYATPIKLPCSTQGVRWMWLSGQKLWSIQSPLLVTIMDMDLLGGVGVAAGLALLVWCSKLGGAYPGSVLWSLLLLTCHQLAIEVKIHGKQQPTELAWYQTTFIYACGMEWNVMVCRWYHSVINQHRLQLTFRTLRARFLLFLFLNPSRFGNRHMGVNRKLWRWMISQKNVIKQRRSTFLHNL